MTAAHESNDIDGPHEGPIKTPKQLILAVLYAFVVPIVGIVLLVMFVTTDKRPAAGSDALSPKAVAERIRPVGVVEVKDASDVASLKSGEQVFAGQCAACHAAGSLGAPKLGDVAVWAARIKTGYDTLLHSALAGKGQMPPQSGGDFSDYEIARAVVYMADKAGAKFPDPPAPVAATPTATTATTAAATGAAAATPVAAAMPTAGGSPKPDPNAGKPATTTQVAATTAAAAAITAPAAATAAPPLYAQFCGTCHTPGIAGAPRLGDKASWAPRIAQGMDVLHASAIKGKGAMPAKGGASASDADVKAVVTYMVNASK
ncbi:MAG: c-type cytochrome [Caldimonas sp.]